MITDRQTARKLVEKIIGTGNKGYLIVVFPEDKAEEELEKKDISFATNANNDVILQVTRLVALMTATGQYKQEILGEEQRQLKG